MKKEKLINFLNDYFERVGNEHIIDEYSIDHDIKITVYDIKRSKTDRLKFYVDSDPIKLEHTIEDDDYEPVTFEMAVWEELRTALDLVGINLSGNYFFFNKRSIDSDLPYDQDEISETVKIRTFSQNLDESELKWHTDNEDRLVKTINKTDWMVQLDNQLPQKLSENKEVFIPKGTYHRLIKGTGDLKVKVKFV